MSSFNTGSGTKPQPSLFGSQPATSQTSSPFSQNNQQPQTSTGTSIFGQQSQQQPQSTLGGTSLFGGNTGTTSAGPGTQPQSNIFGSTSGAQGTQQPQRSIFGSSTTGTQQPQAGLFGSSIPSTQPPTTSLFGTSTTSTQQPTSSLFGTSTANTQQPTTGLFGSTPSSQQPQTGLFGSSATSTQQPQAGGLWGSSTSNTTGSGPFGTLGQGTQQQPQAPSTTNPLQPQATLPAFGPFGPRPPQPQLQQPVAITSTNLVLTKTTKFNDLPEDVKRDLEALDSVIQSQIQISKELHQRKLGEEPLKGYELIKSVHKDFVDCYTTLRHDWHFMRDLKAKADRAVEDTIVATRIVDGFRNLQAGGAASAGYLKEHAGFPFEFFSRVTEQNAARLSWYKSTIEQIERKLKSSSTQAQTPHSIAAALQAQHQTFLALASKAAILDSDLQKVKALYTQLWRQKTGSMRDPFDELDKNAATELEFEALPMNVNGK
ncbi:hypothetical protein JOM56_001258 [Amanita muscaria]